LVAIARVLSEAGVFISPEGSISKVGFDTSRTVA
jgi:hypothetical protein